MRIRYVGKKPFNLDRMYGSNGLWVSHGDILLAVLHFRR